MFDAPETDSFQPTMISIPATRHATTLPLARFAIHFILTGKMNLLSAITQSAPPDNHLLGFKVHHLRM
jgi:hypothetical protein